MGDRPEVGIVLLGLGVVGAGVARALTEKARSLAERTGIRLALRRVLVRDVHRPRQLTLLEGLLTDDPEEALATDCDIVVEVLGGEHPATEYIEKKIGRASCRERV